MDFGYSSRQLQLQKEVAEFALQEAADPSRKKEEAESIFPHEYFRRLCARGWAGLLVPSEYGGQGCGVLEYAIVMEETAKRLLVGPQGNAQVQKALLSSGTEEQKRKYLPKLASGEFLGAVAISEPDAGSSFKKMSTGATREGRIYRLKGHKTHINSAKEAGVLLLLAVSENGLTTFLIEQNTPGVEFKKADPIGMRSMPMYDIFIDCRVGAEQLLGAEGEGLKVFLNTFNLSRIGNASSFIGYARGCLEHAVNYAKNREVGQRRVTDFQGIQWIIAELVAEIEAAKLARDKAAWMEEQGLEHHLETSVAKYLAGEVAGKVVNKVFSIVGSYACYYGRPFEHYLREVKSLEMGGGSSEMMKNNIARQVLRSYLF